MGIEDHLLNDLCCAWLCAPCAIGQHAMAVDRELGYEVEMCCELKWTTATENIYRDGTVSGFNAPSGEFAPRGYAGMGGRGDYRPGEDYMDMKRQFA